jgi:hypothetical protein
MKVVLPGRIDEERCNLFTLESCCLKRGNCLCGPRLLIKSTGDDGIHLASPTDTINRSNLRQSTG